MRRVLPVAIALLLASGAPATADEAADAEALVRTTWYEGLPADAARALGDAGVARLADLLADPSEAPHHGNAVLALGMSGHPHAFEVLRDFAARSPQGEVDRATFRARMQLPLAMGHLARHDPRALAWLLRRARGERAAPAWSFRHHRGDALAVLLDEQVLSGLARSGAPEALPALRRARDEARGGDLPAVRRRRHVDGALALHARVAREGDAALRDPYAEPDVELYRKRRAR